MTLDAVFFDLDGTLLDTALDLSAALNNVLQEDQRPPLPLDQTRAVVSEGSYALVRLAYKLEEKDPKIEALRQRLLNHYENNLNIHTKAFADIPQLIQNLSEHGIVWGVVTNKPKAYAQPLMAQYNFSSSPSCVLSPEDVQQRKPHPESLFLASNIVGCQTNNAIYIGDHRRDIDCGKNAGMVTIAAAYGYIPNGEDINSWQADHVAHSASDLWPIIQQYIA